MDPPSPNITTGRAVSLTMRAYRSNHRRRILRSGDEARLRPRLLALMASTCERCWHFGSGGRWMSPLGSSGRESSGVANGWGEATGSDEQAADDLLKDLEDFDPSVRLSALRALKRLLAREGAVRRLSGELASSASRRRRACLQALAQFEAVEAGSEVWRLADDPDPEVRLSLLRSASALLVDPEPLVRYMSTDPDPLVRESAQEWRRKLPSA